MISIEQLSNLKLASIIFIIVFDSNSNSRLSDKSILDMNGVPSISDEVHERFNFGLAVTTLFTILVGYHVLVHLWWVLLGDVLVLRVGEDVHKFSH